ncbi:MAG: hypothetical protein H0V42_13050 [Nocardioidaceae bacterium]|nr:hypothetical protein [Nocardioidaceae bacterium]
MVALDVNAELDIELVVPGRPPVLASLRGVGQSLELRVDDPGTVAGVGDVAAIRTLADGLADHGLSLRVISGEKHLVTLGATRSPWWHRRLTGSRHIRLGSARGLWTSARSRARSAGGGVLPDRTLAPPATPFPVLPTLVRRPRRITTTHAVRGGGDPKLVLAPRQHPWLGDRKPYFRLRKDRTTLGSGEGCDIRLPGLAELHAEMVLDDNDEFVLVARDGATRVNGERADQQQVRTASRLEIGEWTLTFYREEYADHGRPYGGRLGGEIGHQQPQPARPGPSPVSTGQEAS